MSNYDDIEIDSYEFIDHGFKINWSSAHRGFGSVTFIHKSEFDAAGMAEWVEMDTEYMSKEFVKALVCKMVDEGTIYSPGLENLDQ